MAYYRVANYTRVLTDNCTTFSSCVQRRPRYPDTIHSKVENIRQPICAPWPQSRYSERTLGSVPFSGWLVDPFGIVLCSVVPCRSFRLPVRRGTTQLFKIVYHLVVVLLLGLGRLLLVLTVEVAERVGGLQRLRGGLERGFHGEISSTNEPGRRTRSGIVNRPGILFSLEICFRVKVVTV